MKSIINLYLENNNIANYYFLSKQNYMIGIGNGLKG